MYSKNIVLDLDETLVHTFENPIDILPLKKYPQMFTFLERLYSFSLESYNIPPSYWGIVRPYTPVFLDFCFSHFNKVIVWSAGEASYVNRIVNILFEERPHMVLTRDDCAIDEKGIFYKPLGKICFSDICYRNTFFIDDIEYNVRDNPQNIILIPPYHPTPSITDFEKEDETLLKIMEWLSNPEVMYCRDVRRLDKSKIFT